ncbi:MAG: M14 family metallopeptidase [Balneolaceae bacterium]
MLRLSLSFVSLALLVPLLLHEPSQAQENYRNYQQMTSHLQQLASEYPGKTRLESMAVSPGGHDIWRLTVGTGDLDNKPALAIVAGVDGAHILGIELALQTAEALLRDPRHAELIEDQVFYIIPNLNPDASAQFFSSLVYERSVNARETDLDRDGRVSEDPYQDLNGDGLITMMRVADNTGEWMPHPKDPRVLVKADPLKGERSQYRLFSEGLDSDKDGSFNEDPEGGVNLNKNFTYQYPAFDYGAGEFPVSEAENRALLDWLFDAFNVYAVFTYSPGNNLSNPWTYNRADAAKRVITGILQNDAGVFRSVSELYKEMVPQQNAPRYELQPGGFLEWGYFHYARYSFGTGGWWIPSVSDTDHDEVNALAWADEQGYDIFVEWEEVDHPDFPNQTVEVGGIKPFAMTTPPYALVDSLAGIHIEFITDLAAMRPGLVFENVMVEEAGRNLTRVTMDLYNRGQLPTSTELGTRSQWVRPINVWLDTDGELEMVSGRPHVQIDRLEGGASQRLTWLVRGRGSVSVRAGTPSAGFAAFTQRIR